MVGHADVASVFKGLANVGFAGAHRNVADAQRSQPGVAKHLGPLLAFLARMRQIDVVLDVLDRDVFEADSLHALDGFLDRQLAERVGRDADFQPPPRIG